MYVSVWDILNNYDKIFTTKNIVYAIENSLWLYDLKISLLTIVIKGKQYMGVIWAINGRFSSNLN